MMRKISCWLALAVAMGGCAQTDTLLRPERTTFVNPQRGASPITLAAGVDAQLFCLDWKGRKVQNQDLVQCLYYSVDTEDMLKQVSAVAGDAEARAARNKYISLMLCVSEHNCSTFLGRAFANKSSTDTGRGLFQDVLTGTSAAAANASPQTAAGLGLVNLVVGKGVDNLNSSFYFEQTFQALAAAIASVREQVKADIRKNAGGSATYGDYTIFEAWADMRRYDDACSIRVGLAKLQDLAEDAKRDKEANAQASIKVAEQAKKLLAAKIKVEEIGAELQSYIANEKKRHDLILKTAAGAEKEKLRVELENAAASQARLLLATGDLSKRFEQFDAPTATNTADAAPGKKESATSN